MPTPFVSKNTLYFESTYISKSFTKTYNLSHFTDDSESEVTAQYHSESIEDRTRTLIS